MLTLDASLPYEAVAVAPAALAVQPVTLQKGHLLVLPSRHGAQAFRLLGCTEGLGSRGMSALTIHRLDLPCLQYMENNRHVYLMADWEAAIRAVRAQISGAPQCVQPPPSLSRRSLERPSSSSLQMPCSPLGRAGSRCAWASFCMAGACTGARTTAYNLTCVWLAPACLCPAVPCRGKHPPCCLCLLCSARSGCTVPCMALPCAFEPCPGPSLQMRRPCARPSSTWTRRARGTSRRASLRRPCARLAWSLCATRGSACTVAWPGTQAPPLSVWSTSFRWAAAVCLSNTRLGGHGGRLWAPRAALEQLL